MVRTVARDHDSKRRHILQVAAAVFAREGIARASMNEVARACGISKATIYHYYPSKDDLLFDILDSYLSELRDRICGLELATLAPPDRLRRVTQDVLAAYDGMDHQHKIQSEGIPLLAPDKQETLRAYQRELVQVVADILRACAPETLGRNKTLCRDATMSVFGMLNWFYMWAPEASAADRRRYGQTLADLALTGVGGLTPPPPA